LSRLDEKQKHCQDLALFSTSVQACSEQRAVRSIERRGVIVQPALGFRTPHTQLSRAIFDLEIPQLFWSLKYSLTHPSQDGRQRDDRDRYVSLRHHCLPSVTTMFCVLLGVMRPLAQKTNPSMSIIDYSLANPDTLTKYKTAAQISQKVLETVACTHSSLPCLHSPLSRTV
jgi:hypothetical protein